MDNNIKKLIKKVRDTYTQNVLPLVIKGHAEDIDPDMDKVEEFLLQGKLDEALKIVEKWYIKAYGIVNNTDDLGYGFAWGNVEESCKKLETEIKNLMTS